MILSVKYGLHADRACMHGHCFSIHENFGVASLRYAVGGGLELPILYRVGSYMAAILLFRHLCSICTMYI